MLFHLLERCPFFLNYRLLTTGYFTPMLRFVITHVCRLVLRVFFRRIEIVGREEVPREGGVIFVVNHPNALVDPLFLLCFAGRRVSFLAKSTLLRMPVIGLLARALDTLPVYRRQDAGEQTQRNGETFRSCRALLARGGCIAICPEGVSHNEPRLLRLKTGAARIALGAAACGGEASPPTSRTCVEVKIVPVGLYYTDKSVFRSEALVRFGAPVDVPSLPADEDGEPAREAVAELTARIEAAMRRLVISVDEAETLRRVGAAERIWSSEPDATGGDALGTHEDDASLRREAEMRRRFADGYELLRGEAGETGATLAELERRINRYDRILRLAEVDPRDVTTIERAPGVLLRRALAGGSALVALLPAALPGALLHYPAYRLAGVCARSFSGGSDDMLATIKMLAAALLFPLTWVVAALAAYFYAGSAAALAVLATAPLAGYAAVRFLEIEDRLGERLRALGFARRDRAFFERLVAERRRIRGLVTRLASETQGAA